MQRTSRLRNFAGCWYKQVRIAPQGQRVDHAVQDEIPPLRNRIGLAQVHAGDAVTLSHVVKPLRIQVHRRDDPLADNHGNADRACRNNDRQRHDEEPVLEETVAIERQTGERRDDVRVAEHPHVEEQNRPEPGGLEHDRDAGGERPGGGDDDQGEVELRVPEPGEGGRSIERGRNDESAGRASHIRRSIRRKPRGQEQDICRELRRLSGAGSSIAREESGACQRNVPAGAEFEPSVGLGRLALSTSWRQIFWLEGEIPC